MNKFTNAEIREALITSIEERGHDYQYSPPSGTTCVYADENGEPSCLIGMVIHKLDPEAFKALAIEERAIGSTVLGASAASVVPQYLDVDRDILEGLRKIQDDQDNRMTYGNIARMYGLTQN